MKRRPVAREGAAATADQVAEIEARVHALCDYHLPRIPEMSAKRLYCFLWRRLMALDFERGLMPGQIPHRTYRHTSEFTAWETAVFDAVLARQKIVGDEWPGGSSEP